MMLMGKENVSATSLFGGEIKGGRVREAIYLSDSEGLLGITMVDR